MQNGVAAEGGYHARVENRCATGTKALRGAPMMRQPT